MTTDEPLDAPADEELELEEADDWADEDDEEIDPIIAMLRKERLARGWTQWDVARRMGFAAPSYVSMLESGERDLLLSTLRAWAATMDIEILGRVPKSNRGRPRRDFR